MSDRAWRVDELEQEPMAPESPSPSLVTLHFLLTALRRRWPVWVGVGCAGMLLGMMWALAFPQARVGTVTLLLAHDPSADVYSAQSTDLSLLRTRTLAADVVERLDLQMSPEEFRSSVVSVPASPDVLVLEVSGPDDAAAVARTGALADAYLEFRASQFRSQLQATTRGYAERISAARRQIEQLSRQYEEVRASSPGDEQRLSALLNRQAQLTTQIQSSRQSIDDARLKQNSVIEASYVLDPAKPKPPPSQFKAVFLAMASGLVAGTAIGVGFVLVSALTSSRLRRREEVAQALDTRVRISVGGRLRPPWWPMKQRSRLPASALGTLVDALEREVSRRPTCWPPTAGTERPREAVGRFLPTHLALATVETGGVGELVISHLAARLSARELDVFVVDLSEAGGVETALSRALDEREGPETRRRPVVHRPGRMPSLEDGPLDSAATLTTGPPSDQSWREAWEQADVSLALAEVDPALGAEHVKSWADEVVVLVAAGRSSAERLRTAGELIRSAGLRLLFAMMVGRDRTDESPGLGDDAYPGWWLPARSVSASTPASRDSR